MAASHLDRAKAAVDNGNWSIAIDQLQHLSIDQIVHNEVVLDIALQVLIQGDFDQQWEIAKIIPKLGYIAIQPLLDLLNDGDIDLEDRWVVARILGEFDQPQVVTALIELIQHQEDLELTEIATSALTKIGVPAISALIDLLATPNRHIAVATLAQIRHSKTIKPLIQVINDDDPQLRSLVVEALGSFHDPRIPPLLLTKLTDVAATVRKAAVIALCLRSDLAAELDLSQHLRPLLFDLNLAVCQATALGLARLPDLQNIEVLTEVLLSPQTPPELQSSVILALGWIGTKPAINSLIASLPQASTSLAPEIVMAIGKTDREQVYASQILVNYLQTANPSATIIKQEIATALGNLGNPAIILDLRQLLDDPDDRVKLYAINAISKL
ncbi:MAG: HEAT repeat domain-containing protein [Chamaesiphon sp.]|nr:HEAT repeat domain-containing protein [Chamaesiphon sp.]